MAQFHAVLFWVSCSSTIDTISDNSQNRSVTTAASTASNGRGQLRKVITQLARAAIFLMTIGLTEDAWSGPRIYDLNILMRQPHPFVSEAPSAAVPSAAVPSAEPPPTVFPSTPAPVEPVKESPPIRGSSPSRQGHNYTFKVRFLPWLTQITGEVSGGGDSRTLDFHDDLGLDDFEFNLSGSANLRLGRHDLWLDALVIDMSGSNVVAKSFTFGSLSVDASRRIKTEIDLERYDIRYGYSFFDLDANGFRLGPTFGVAYLDFDVTISDEESGEKGSISEDFPVPRVGLRGEMPFGDFLVEADLAGFYIDYDDYEGYAVEANLSVVWRPNRYVGLVGGYRVFAIDIDDSDNNYDVTFHGPYLGLELRY